MEIKTQFSEDIPVRLAVQGLPEVNTDIWKISNISCSISEMIVRIMDDEKSFEIISTSERDNTSDISIDISFEGMPLEKPSITKSFKWVGEYVRPTLPSYHIEGVNDDVDNGEYIYNIILDDAGNYPITCDWSVEKIKGDTGAMCVGVSNDRSFSVTYSGLEESDSNSLFEITVNIKPKYNPSKIIDTLKFKIHTVYDLPVITADSNPGMMWLCHKAGWCSSEVKMYKDECEAVTSIGDKLMYRDAKVDPSYSQYPTSMDELQYFTGITEIPNDAFHNNDGKLTSIIIPANVTRIGTSAFQGCFGLRNIKLNSNLATIDGNAFYYCSNLSSIELNEGLKYIGPGAFSNCKFTDIKFPSTVTTVGDCLKDINTLKSVDMSETQVEFIPITFMHSTTSSKIELSVYLPSTVKLIGAGAFANPNIKEIAFLPISAPETNNSFIYNNIKIGQNHDSGKLLYIPGASTGYESWNTWFDEISGWTITKTL